MQDQTRIRHDKWTVLVQKVRACRQAAPQPMPSWKACEERVQAAEAEIAAPAN
jgi:hypothetical protein